MMIQEYISPDGLLRFHVVTGEDGDVSLGFDGFPWHTHADILAAASGLSQEDAVKRFVSDLVSGNLVIVLWWVDGVWRDVWVSDNPVRDAAYADAETNEVVTLRYWDGRKWSLK